VRILEGRTIRLLRRTGLAVIAVAALGAAPASGQSPLQWNGYAQIRYTHSSTSSGFALRRAKFWMRGPVPGVDALSFKVQGIFRNGAQGAFVLQDLFAEYHGRAASLRVGQMVPDFSLQRSQPDYQVPLTERAGVVDALIPGATTLARDIGVQLSLAPGTGPLHLSVGLFNGTGANRLNTAKGDFLATARATYTRELGGGVTGTAGGSIEMRSADGIDVGVLSTTGAPYVGHEVRWGTEARLVASRWTLQGEYLEAHLGDDVSRGFYVLGTYAASPADEAVLSVERLRTPKAGVSAAPWYIVGFDHVLDAPERGHARGGHLPSDNGGGTPTKLMADVRARSTAARTEYQATLQLQVFVH
jgi:hypothetical protein